MQRCILLLGAAATGAGCYPTGFDTISESDVVATFQQVPETVYQRNRTFVMTSTVFDLVDITDLDCRAGDDELDDRFDPTILDRVRQNMLANNYVEELQPELNPPDVGVFVGKVVCDNWSVYWYPGWGGWWGGFPPIYYPVPVPTNYRTGTILFPIIEIGDREPDDIVNVLWHSVVDGLVSSSAANNETRIVDNIDQAFEQSPYLELQSP